MSATAESDRGEAHAADFIAPSEPTVVEPDVVEAHVSDLAAPSNTTVSTPDAVADGQDAISQVPNPAVDHRASFAESYTTYDSDRSALQRPVIRSGRRVGDQDRPRRGESSRTPWCRPGDKHVPAEDPLFDLCAAIARYRYL